MSDPLDALIAQLPKEVALLVTALREKISILEDDIKLLHRENTALKDSLDLVVRSNQNLIEENLKLRK